MRTAQATGRAAKQPTGHFRPELPNAFVKEAKRLHALNVSITDIHRILADPKSYIHVNGFKNASINYYDVWCILGFNRRKEEKAVA